nr:MAG TPA: hypothetical protein [Caudoviricetes sp.]
MTHSTNESRHLFSLFPSTYIDIISCSHKKKRVYPK